MHVQCRVRKFIGGFHMSQNSQDFIKGEEFEGACKIHYIAAGYRNFNNCRIQHTPGPSKNLREGFARQITFSTGRHCLRRGLSASPPQPIPCAQPRSGHPYMVSAALQNHTKRRKSRWINSADFGFCLFRWLWILFVRVILSAKGSCRTDYLV